mmetsp:Transcript_42377/g.128552  ORF Transcript_42377/g.128552 Transcript_42377/m.128552 type:complete len:92 (-) Transcript_42377:428-703(-)
MNLSLAGAGDGNADRASSSSSGRSRGVRAEAPPQRGGFFRLSSSLAPFHAPFFYPEREVLRPNFCRDARSFGDESPSNPPHRRLKTKPMFH